MDPLTNDGEGLAGTKFFEDVVHFRHGERWIRLLLTFAMGVELFGQEPNAFALRFHSFISKRKEFETSRLNIDGTIFEQ